MIEITDNIYVGNDQDYNQIINNHFIFNTNEWAFLHCAKIPFHQKMARYNRDLPRNHPDYKYKIIGNRMALNLIDFPEYDSIWKEHYKVMFHSAVEFLNEQYYEEGKKILIHCNQGISRGPSLAMLFLANIGFYNYKNFEETEKLFKNDYIKYNPKECIKNNIKNVWQELVINRFIPSGN